MPKSTSRRLSAEGRAIISATTRLRWERWRASKETRLPHTSNETPQPAPTTPVKPLSSQGDTMLTTPDSKFCPRLDGQKPTSDVLCRIHTTVPPYLAEEWLKNANVDNYRRLREDTYIKYASDMEAGRWLYTGDPIQFDKDGHLLNGQHRLTACVLSGIPLEADIMFGLAPATANYMDLNWPRSADTIAHNLGVQNASCSCALARMLLVHRSGGIATISGASWPTKTEVIELARTDMRIQKIAGLVVLRHAFMTNRTACFCYYLFSEQDQEKADIFFEQLANGLDLTEDSPVYFLRERLINNKSSKAKLPNLDIIALTFKAWRAYRDGKIIKTLRWSDAEGFPEI